MVLCHTELPAFVHLFSQMGLSSKGKCGHFCIMMYTNRLQSVQCTLFFIRKELAYSRLAVSLAKMGCWFPVFFVVQKYKIFARWGNKNAISYHLRKKTVSIEDENLCYCAEIQWNIVFAIFARKFGYMTTILTGSFCFVSGI